MSIGINIGISVGSTGGKGYGPELIVNGYFTTDLSGWVNTDSYWQWVVGEAYHPLIDAYRPFRQNIIMDISKNYLVSYDVRVIQGIARSVISVDGSGQVQALFEVGIHNYSEIKTNFNRIEFTRSVGTATEYYVDNVSIKEIL